MIIPVSIPSPTFRLRRRIKEPPGPAPGFDVQFIDSHATKNSPGSDEGPHTHIMTVPAGGVPAGATIFVTFVSRNDGSSSELTNVSLTDPAENTYNFLYDAMTNPGSLNREAVFAAYNVDPLSQDDDIVLEWSGASGSAANAQVSQAFYVEGLDYTHDEGSPLIDGFQFGAVSSSSGNTSGDLTVGTAPALLIGLFRVSRDSANFNITEDANFTSIHTVGTTLSTDTRNRTNHTAFRAVEVTDDYAYNPTIDDASFNTAGIAAFKLVVA